MRRPDAPASPATSRLAIDVRGLVERFRVPSERPPGIKERLTSFRRVRYAVFTALRGVSLQVRHGETVALIGHNGSGKSTLLKCLAGILPADEGSVTVNGRIATLLELGAGFHPDLSGRENVYLNGALLGLSRREIDRDFDAIVDFAGVAEFIDSPVRNFSSGMYVRLGFAIAVHVDPDILLVDEVLAVGDAEFQAKSLARMRGFGERGKTVVLVSHDLAAVRSLCRRTVVLDHGRIAFDGPTPEAIEYYSELVAGRGRSLEPAAVDLDRSGDGGARFVDARLLTAVDGDSREPAGALPSGGTAQVVVTFSADAGVQDDGSLSVGLAVRRPDMQLYVYETRTSWRRTYLAPPRPGATATVTFTVQLAVLAGEYLVDLLLVNASTTRVHDRWAGALRFTVDAPEHDFGVARFDARIGIWNPDGHWPDDLHAPPLERGGPREHPLREDRPSPGYEADVPRITDATPSPSA